MSVITFIYNYNYNNNTTLCYSLFFHIMHAPLNSSKPDTVYEDPQLEENIAYVAGEPEKEDEEEGVYEPYSL